MQMYICIDGDMEYRLKIAQQFLVLATLLQISYK